MPRDIEPASVRLRMSRQLRDGIRAAADDAGCSLNAYAIQVLAAAAGDPGRFRASNRVAAEPQAIERDALGYPLEWRARSEHVGARTDFMGTMSLEEPDAWVDLVKKYDAEDPGYFVEWHRLKMIERAAEELQRR